MVRVAPINLAYNPRTLWFDPGDLEVKKNDPVVVETARGIEFGTAAQDIIEVADADIEALKSPLKPVVRLATPEDVDRARELERRSREALPVFKEMAAEVHEDMHPVSVEFLLDGDKAIFYFEAEDRIDFRELVRRLAAHFKVRIDMRQIGVRDEARIVGGLGHCGQELCCKRMGGEFSPVSIRMAKEQDLSLNPQKISGLCGRLMCCLRYEYEAYKDFKSRAPKMNATIQTPAGPAKVVELDVPREIVSLKVGDEKPVKVSLADFDPADEGARPTSIGQEAWDFATAEEAPGYRSNALTFLTSQFTGTDKLADAGTVRRGSSSSRAVQGDGAKSASKRSGSQSRGSKAVEKEAPAPERKPRRRRSTKIADGEIIEASTVAEPSKEQVAAEKKTPTRRSRGRGGSAAAEGVTTNEKTPSKRTRGAEQSRDEQTTKSAEGKAGSRRGRGRARSEKDTRNAPIGANEKIEKVKTGPRPGQKSSGLRKPIEGSAPIPPEAQAGAQEASSSTRRRPRRRSRSKSGENSASQGSAE